ncbi:MAG TPA: hypothetical protein VFV89_04525 [Nocardioides sp.]|uniref:hypothetical protein n=1 Tax=Nocardioides sp. TaxID=35761 RepID=UPI002E31737B|nr:hypothetical protein [Nocardioides sp.]HEX5087050.1 hypothetical protein [Nocardioides sp.]
MRLPADRCPDWGRTRRAVVLAVVLVLGVSGCQSEQEQYCDAVKDHQQELSEVLGDGSPDALLKALPIFEDLADDAPDDIRDDWKTVIDALDGLQEALDDAGVDPATYDRDHPPAGLSEADQEAIDQAAAQVGSQASTTAFNAVDQEAKDVCGTPLQLG